MAYDKLTDIANRATILWYRHFLLGKEEDYAPKDKGVVESES